ncbi:MAG TPA: type III-A CRISPR-associated RAMP protein Csm3 [Candidatus Ozemobacteraceae bacterium]|mgnify:CR=1 FL=1|nr:type III-A CRISPR-associated RAMP protein Csm3 [Candidatus Ozemobacteraceae bacterium]
MELKLKAIKKLEGKIVLKSGLHIGAGNDAMHIGGTDNPVIRHPHTYEPYIPGSSLKGKTRSLLELASGLASHPQSNGGLVSLKTYEAVKDTQVLARAAKAILATFGCSGSDQKEGSPFGPSRASFSDCHLDEAWKKKAQDNAWSFTEEKSENSIDRIKGVAQNPRVTERVPAGAEFRFCVTFKILTDEDETFFQNLVTGLKLLELDAIGGSGSRGYGRIRFAELRLDGSDYMEKFDAIKAL